MNSIPPAKESWKLEQGEGHPGPGGGGSAKETYIKERKALFALKWVHTIYYSHQLIKVYILKIVMTPSIHTSSKKIAKTCGHLILTKASNNLTRSI